jgi:hypothetical protein
VGLTAAGVPAVAVIVIADAVGAHRDDAVSRWTGWATVAAVPLAALAEQVVDGEVHPHSGGGAVRAGAARCRPALRVGRALLRRASGRRSVALCSRGSPPVPAGWREASQLVVNVVILAGPPQWPAEAVDHRARMIPGRARGYSTEQGMRLMYPAPASSLYGALLSTPRPISMHCLGPRVGAYELTQ